MIEKGLRIVKYDILQIPQPEPRIVHPDEGEAFQLRAHRIFMVRGLDFTYNSPKKMVQAIANRENRDDETDYFGINNAYKQKTLSSWRDTLLTYRSLKNGHPIELTEGVPDQICQACAIGNHCNGNNNDSLYMNSFIAYAENQKVDKFLRVESDKTRRVTVAKGTFRFLLQQFPVPR